jgi:hypothetical protein
MSDRLLRPDRLQIMLSPEELKAVDDFRFEQRMPSRAAAVRELMRRGLGAVGHAPAETGERSANFGVLSDGKGARSRRAKSKPRPVGADGAG